MKIEFINNTGITTLGHEFQSQAKSCQHFNIASAFITEEAILILNIFLNKNKNAVKAGRLITGLYHCFNSKEILLELQKLSRSTKGKLQVKISKTKKFHWKYYDFENKKERVIYIGSSNFTDAGMYKAGELQTKITIKKIDKKLKENSDQIFADEWENAVDIADFPLDKYKAFKQPKGMGGKLDPAILKLLSSARKDNINKDLQPVRSIKIYGTLSRSTMNLISLNQSHWDKNNWDYFVCQTKSEYDHYAKNACLFVINKNGNKYDFELVVVEDKCALKTKDGNYFIAYKSRGRGRKESLQLGTLLNDCGINYRSRGELDRKLTKKQVVQIRNLFKLTKIDS